MVQGTDFVLITPEEEHSVKSAVRNALGEMNVSSDFYDALDAEVQAVLDNAERRPKETVAKLSNPETSGFGRECG